MRDRFGLAKFAKKLQIRLRRRLQRGKDALPLGCLRYAYLTPCFECQIQPTQYCDEMYSPGCFAASLTSRVCPPMGYLMTANEVLQTPDF